MIDNTERDFADWLNEQYKECHDNVPPQFACSLKAAYMAGRAQVAAGDALLKVAKDYFDNAECEIVGLDSAMGRAIIAYEVAKGVKP